MTTIKREPGTPVLIPFYSGRGSSKGARSAPPLFLVLIPFYSGRGSSVAICSEWGEYDGLNPFLFRAWF